MFNVVLAMKCSASLVDSHFVRRWRFGLGSQRVVRVLWVVCAVLLGLAWPAAEAGNFSVSPVRIYMKPRERAAAITVINLGREPLLFQAEVWHWTQDAQGKESLEPTSEIIVAPPIATIAPGGRQVLRVAPVRAPDMQRELTYRLIVREVVPERPASEGVSMSLALAMSMPVFITPQQAKPVLVCGLQAPEQISCSNQGTAYTQLRGFRLERDGQVLWRSQQGQYLLPGAQVLLPGPPAGLRAPGVAAVPAGAAQLMVETDGLQQPAFPVTVP